jgi:hypothetical protein
VTATVTAARIATGMTRHERPAPFLAENDMAVLLPSVRVRLSRTAA